MTWLPFGVCPCGWTKIAPGAQTFFMQEECCPECGTLKWRWAVEILKWDVANQCFVGKVWHSAAVWYQPWTWGRGQWVEQPQSHLRAGW